MDNELNSKKFDLQVVSAHEVNIEDVKTSFASLADREDLNLDPDLMYAKFIMCHEGDNANGDCFTKDVLMRAQYTPRFKPIDWEHGQPMIGTILDSRFAIDAEGRAYIEAIGVIWKFMYPELAEQIKAKASTGGLRLSMECYFKDANYKYGDQVYDSQQATDLGLDDYVGREYMGQKVYRVFKDVIFGGVGVVANPADKEAIFLAVAKAKEDSENMETAIADIIRTTNDFNEKMLNKETLDAITLSKYLKALDKAKNSIVAKFNNDEIATKEQVISELGSIVDNFISEISEINSKFYTKTASESEGELEAEQNENLDGEEGGTEMPTENEHLETEVVETEVAEVEATEVTEVTEVVEPEAVVETPVVEEVEVVDHEAKATELSSIVEDLEAQLKQKDEAFNELKSKFDALNDKVEASEKEAVTASRVAELEEMGVSFSEARKAKEVEKISAMDNDQFADYKEFLNELVAKHEAVEATETEVVEEVVAEEISIEGAETSSASLNIELEAPKAMNPFGHLTI